MMVMYMYCLYHCGAKIKGSIYNQK